MLMQTRLEPEKKVRSTKIFCIIGDSRYIHSLVFMSRRSDVQQRAYNNERLKCGL
jgi:hypothetical protein